MAGLKTEDIKLVFVALWRNRLLVLLVTLAGIFAGLIYAEYVDDTFLYKATSTICVTYTTYQEQMSGVSVLTNYTEVVTSNRVCEYAAMLLSDIGITPNRVKSSIGVSLGTSSYVMRVSATYSNPDVAMRIANAVAEAYVAQITQITGSSAIQILDGAKTYSTVPGNEKRDGLLLVTAAAFLLICGVVVLKSLFSNKIRSIYQCFDDENEILAIVPYEEKGKSSGKNMLRGFLGRPS